MVLTCAMCSPVISKKACVHERKPSSALASPPTRKMRTVFVTTYLAIPTSQISEKFSRDSETCYTHAKTPCSTLNSKTGCIAATTPKLHPWHTITITPASPNPDKPSRASHSPPYPPSPPHPAPDPSPRSDPSESSPTTAAPPQYP